ncbi:NCS2 family permease [Myxococcota bacterium]|nr:NCS2 family permease [Myxococcota bacterium]
MSESKEAIKTENFIERYFKLAEHGSTTGTEVRAGFTTFVTMAYILFVNPAILGLVIKVEGVDMQAELLSATAIAAGIGTLVMGLWARYPFALAPGMGINAYFTFSVVMGMGIPWQTALGAVFISGAFFLVLSVVGARDFLVNAIPGPIKMATTAGIGLFLALIGLNNAGLVRAHPATLVTLGDLGEPGPLLALATLVLITALMAAKVRGALLIGMVAATAVALVFSLPLYNNGQIFAGFEGGLFNAPVFPTHLFLELDLEAASGMGIVGIVFVFLFVDLFDTAGTLLGLSERTGYTDAQGRLPRADAAFGSDAIATMSGALLGTSSTTTYVESAAGVEDGGRTGLTSVVTGLLFLMSVFFSSFAGVVPSAATAPVLIIVGALMAQSVVKIDWEDLEIGLPAFLTMILMPFTYSIANGISAGIISFVLIKLLRRKHREVHWLMIAMAILLILRYAWLAGA